jgi:uncharacterized membrane protein (DUF373 family)
MATEVAAMESGAQPPEPQPMETAEHRELEATRHERHIFALVLFEDLMHYGVALVLVGISGAVLFRTVKDLFTPGATFWVAIPTAVDGVLFVVIVLEIFRTVIAHFEKGGFQLKPFLIIGIISAVRHVLTVGARLSIQSQNADASQSSTQFTHSLWELGINAGVVLALVIGLVLIKRSDLLGGTSDDD